MSGKQQTTAYTVQQYFGAISNYSEVSNSQKGKSPLSTTQLPFEALLQGTPANIRADFIWPEFLCLATF